MYHASRWSRESLNQPMIMLLIPYTVLLSSEHGLGDMYWSHEVNRGPHSSITRQCLDHEWIHGKQRIDSGWLMKSITVSTDLPRSIAWMRPEWMATAL
jgi:hypothetical protein